MCADDHTFVCVAGDLYKKIVSEKCDCDIIPSSSICGFACSTNDLNWVIQQLDILSVCIKLGETYVLSKKSSQEWTLTFLSFFFAVFVYDQTLQNRHSSENSSEQRDPLRSRSSSLAIVGVCFCF